MASTFYETEISVGAAKLREKPEFEVQWSPVNLVTNGPQKYGRINTATVLQGFFLFYS